MTARPFIATGLRIFGWFALGAILFEAVEALAVAGYPHWIAAEGGPLEQLHVAIPLVAGAMLFALGRRYVSARSFYTVLACLAWIGAFRELDLFFARNVFYGAYHLVTTPLGAWGAWLLVRDRSAVFASLARFATTPAFALMLVAVFVLTVFAQLVGQGDLWRAMMGDNYQRDVKDLVEEISETLAYVILLAATVEAWLQERAGRGAA